MSKRSNACDITQKVKKTVWERDNHQCIICGSPYAMPNSHYISRAKGGLGIEQNVVTMCLECHNAYDNGYNKEKKEYIKDKTKKYLQDKYENWNEEDLYYNKWKNYGKI